MKNTFLLKTASYAIYGIGVFGATAFVITVLALCGVPITWWIGALCAVPGWLLYKGLNELFGNIIHELVEADAHNFTKQIEAALEDEKCRFHEGGKCTFGDGLEECAHEAQDDEEEHRIRPMEVKKIVSCEDASVEYLEFRDGIRLISQDGIYVGWYRCAPEADGDGVSDHA